MCWIREGGVLIVVRQAKQFTFTRFKPAVGHEFPLFPCDADPKVGCDTPAAQQPRECGTLAEARGSARRVSVRHLHEPHHPLEIGPLLLLVGPSLAFEDSKVVAPLIRSVKVIRETGLFSKVPVAMVLLKA